MINYLDIEKFKGDVKNATAIFYGNKAGVIDQMEEFIDQYLGEIVDDIIDNEKHESYRAGEEEGRECGIDRAREMAGEVTMIKNVIKAQGDTLIIAREKIEQVAGDISDEPGEALTVAVAEINTALDELRKAITDE